MMRMGWEECDVQHPSQTTMQLGIDTLQIRDGYFLL